MYGGRRGSPYGFIYGTAQHYGEGRRAVLGGVRDIFGTEIAMGSVINWRCVRIYVGAILTKPNYEKTVVLYSGFPYIHV